MISPASPRPVGFHVSIERGLHRAVGRAVERGCTAFQVFCGNPRGWALQRRSDEELERFRELRAGAGLAPLVVHSCYLINPCTSDGATFRRSVARLAAELDLSARMGAEAYVLHPGSHKGRDPEWRVRRAAEAIGRAGLANLLRHPDLARLPLILETPWESVDVDRRNLRAVRSLLRQVALRRNAPP